MKGSTSKINPTSPTKGDPNRESTLGRKKFWFHSNPHLLTIHRYTPPTCVWYHVFSDVLVFFIYSRSNDSELIHSSIRWMDREQHGFGIDGLQRIHRLFVG